MAKVEAKNRSQSTDQEAGRVSAGTELCPPKVLKTQSHQTGTACSREPGGGGGGGHFIVQPRDEDLAFKAISNGESLMDRRNTRHTASQLCCACVAQGGLALVFSLSAACQISGGQCELGQGRKCCTLCSEADSLGQGTITELPEQHKHRLAARAQAAVGRLLLGSSRKAPAERSHCKAAGALGPVAAL